jgi:DNA (cytosine-5)-methyltransferase 3A
MNVLSLFDGMSCGQQALQRSGINVNNYYASEIDKYGIKVTMANYPNTIQLGSVVDVDGYKLPKIDLLIGGSPCQSFSFAGKRKGMSTKDEQEILTLEHYLKLKSEGFEFEGQSYLFWEYMRLLNEVKPKYFLLENVEMGEKWEKVLSKAIGVNGIHINSALVSAQNRRRIYWTNIGMEPSGLFGDLESIIEQPKDKGILLKDILENQVDEKYFLSEKSFIFNRIKNNHPFTPRIPNENQKSNCIKIGGSGVDDLIYHNTMPRSSTTGKGGTGHLSRADGKTYCLDTGNTNAVEIVAVFYRYDKGHEWRDDNKTGCLTTLGSRTNSGSIHIKEVKQINTSKESGNQQPYMQNRVFDINGINPALTTLWNGANLINTSRIRRLTPIECERLQTVADNYTNHVSDSQRYKMLGNGWTVDVIAHIFKYINK